MWLVYEKYIHICLSQSPLVIICLTKLSISYYTKPKLNIILIGLLVARKRRVTIQLVFVPVIGVFSLYIWYDKLLKVVKLQTPEPKLPPTSNKKVTRGPGRCSLVGSQVVLADHSGVFWVLIIAWVFVELKSLTIFYQPP